VEANQNESRPECGERIGAGWLPFTPPALGKSAEKYAQIVFQTVEGAGKGVVVLSVREIGVWLFAGRCSFAGGQV